MGPRKMLVHTLTNKMEAELLKWVEEKGSEMIGDTKNFDVISSTKMCFRPFADLIVTKPYLDEWIILDPYLFAAELCKSKVISAASGGPNIYHQPFPDKPGCQAVSVTYRIQGKHGMQGSLVFGQAIRRQPDGTYRATVLRMRVVWEDLSLSLASMNLGAEGVNYNL